jgi:hypothetical protein
VCLSCIIAKAEKLWEPGYFLEKEIEKIMDDRNKSVVLSNRTLLILKNLQRREKGHKIMVTGAGLSGTSKNSPLMFKRIDSSDSFKS